MDDAVEKIYSAYNTSFSHEVLGYYFRKIDTKGNVSGGNFAFNESLVGLREIYYRYGFVGELAIVLKTNLIKEYSFPQYTGERFVSEKVFYNQITSIAPMVYIDDVIYVFEYQESGYTLSANRLLVKNPKGAAAGFLSDAIYGTSLLSQAKAYASFASVKRIFRIPDEFYAEGKVKTLVKIAATLLRPHYNKLFKRLQAQHNGEER
jgi:hypothetical protein